MLLIHLRNLKPCVKKSKLPVAIAPIWPPEPHEHEKLPIPSGRRNPETPGCRTPHVIRIKINPGKPLVSPILSGWPEFWHGQFRWQSIIKGGWNAYLPPCCSGGRLFNANQSRFQGEEWLPSAPVHILLWKYLFGLDAMPQWAHLPLILKPDGNGKPSKRDGDRLGFPVYAMDWKTPTGEPTKGF